MTTQTTIDQLRQELDLALGPLGIEDRRLARTLVRLLAGGEPVDTEHVGDALGIPTPEAAEAIARLPWVYRDEGDRVIGAWGMSVADLAKTPHRLILNGQELFAWCAADALFLPLVLGRSAQVASRCPTTGERIRLRVGPDGIGERSPRGTVLSLLRIGEDAPARDAITSFCHFIHFFASGDAAEAWIARHDGTFQVSLDDAFDLARFWAERGFGVDPDRAASER